MPPIETKTMGKEQLILLPVESKTFTLLTDPPGQVQMQTGREAIVVSGFASIKDGGGFFVRDDTEEDEQIFEWEFHLLVGPVWRSIIQVSAHVTLAGIISHDSDDVDHSRWVLKECTWDEVDVEGGKQIRLKVKTDMQGDGNGLINFGYQVTATGWLSRMPTPDEISADLS